MYFNGININLRALEPEDLDWLFALENDESLWHISLTHQPFSKYLLAEYIKNAKQSIFEAQQMRLVIQTIKNEPVGLIDLYEFNAFHKRAGIGIIILKEYRNKGYASEALRIIIKYSFEYLKLHQLYAQITVNNSDSLQLFQNSGFQITGTKKEWNNIENHYYDEYFLQLVNSL